jgi:hypothetical protein
MWTLVHPLFLETLTFSEIITKTAVISAPVLARVRRAVKAVVKVLIRKYNEASEDWEDLKDGEDREDDDDDDDDDGEDEIKMARMARMQMRDRNGPMMKKTNLGFRVFAWTPKPLGS